MSNELKYRLPESRDKVIGIVDLFPQYGEWRGRLIAPREVYEQGRIAKHTLLSIQSPTCPLELSYTTHFARPFEDGQENSHPYTADFLEDVITGGKLPARVDINGGKHHFFDRCAKKVVMHYLREGYKGKISTRQGLFCGSNIAQMIALSHDEGTVFCAWNNTTQPEEIKNFLQKLQPLNLTQIDVCTTVGR